MYFVFGILIYVDNMYWHIDNQIHNKLRSMYGMEVFFFDLIVNPILGRSTYLYIGVRLSVNISTFSTMYGKPVNPLNRCTNWRYLLNEVVFDDLHIWPLITLHTNFTTTCISFKYLSGKKWDSRWVTLETKMFGDEFYVHASWRLDSPYTV